MNEDEPRGNQEHGLRPCVHTNTLEYHVPFDLDLSVIQARPETKQLGLRIVLAPISSLREPELRDAIGRSHLQLAVEHTHQTAASVKIAISTK